MDRFAFVLPLFALTAYDNGAATKRLEDQLEILETENDRLQQTINSEKQASTMASETYQACMADAFSNYNQRWNKGCARIRKINFQERELCMQQGGSEETCAQTEIAPSKDCALPTETASRYDDGYTEDKKICLERLKIGR